VSSYTTPQPATQRKLCLALQHLAFEDLGTLGDVLTEQGFEIVYRQAGVHALDGPQAEAEWAQADLVVVLGGPVGVYETDRYPFITHEIARVKARLDSGKPLVGICLGAQMMAAACGQRVYPGPAKEIGFKPLILSAAGQASPLAALQACSHQVLHWHGDTFDLPPQATLLASTDLVKHQVFSLGPKVLGLQCHLEAQPRELERWLIGHAAELSAAGISLDTLRTDNTRHGVALAEAARSVWRQWLVAALPA
jgi:GMP synthase (glutamine-hydrolysing)